MSNLYRRYKILEILKRRDVTQRVKCLVWWSLHLVTPLTVTATRPTSTGCFVVGEDSVSAGGNCAERGARRDLAKQSRQRQEFHESFARKGLLAYHKVRVWVKLAVEEREAGRVEASDALEFLLSTIRRLGGGTLQFKFGRVSRPHHLHNDRSA